MEKQRGISAAVDAAMRNEPEQEEPTQAVLFPLEGAPDDTADGEIVPRGKGRPPGSKNRRTEAWTAYIVGQYGSPLEALAKIYSADTEKLAAKVGATKEDALKMQIGAANAALPYVHQRLPQAVEVKGEGLPILNFTIGQVQATAMDQGLFAGEIKDLTKQGLIEGESREFDAESLTQDHNSLNTNEKSD